MTSKLVHFLLVYDHARGKLLDRREFDDGDEAVAAYAAMEREYQDERLIEIVLIGSDSIQTVMLTHANYFDGTVTVSPYLAGI